jgi:hypothetical protein
MMSFIYATEEETQKGRRPTEFGCGICARPSVKMMTKTHPFRPKAFLLAKINVGSEFPHHSKAENKEQSSKAGLGFGWQDEGNYRYLSATTRLVNNTNQWRIQKEIRRPMKEVVRN